jgi:hypothetical protein
MQRVAAVSFETLDGNTWAHVTMASSLFEAVGRAGDRFATWQGPRPAPDQVFKVSLVGDDRVWWVSSAASFRANPSIASH